MQTSQCSALLTKGLQTYSYFCAITATPTTPGNMLLLVMLINIPLAPKSEEKTVFMYNAARRKGIVYSIDRSNAASID